MTLTYCHPDLIKLNYLMSPDSPGKFALTADSKGAIIAVSHHCCDLIFPGACLRIPRGFACTKTHVVGRVELRRIKSSQAEQQARSHRLEDIKLLQRILQSPTKEQRACLLINLLCRKLGYAIVRNIPAEILASVVATSPAEIMLARDRYESSLSTLASGYRMGDSNFLSWQRRLWE